MTLSKSLQLLLKISRPKFWLYLAGTYMVGYIAGSTYQTGVFSHHFFLYFFFFLLPGNIFLYGINDYFDYETDKYNSRKNQQEYRIHSSEKKLIRIALTISIMIAFLIIFFEKVFPVKLLMLFFLFLSAFYSMPPLRFKTKIVFDSLSNVLYLIPGVIGYIQQTHSIPPVALLVGFACWPVAMHLFSAIPDIPADTSAHLKTSAIYFGQNLSIIICSLLWFCFFLAIIQLPILFPYSLILILYPLIPLGVFFCIYSIKKAYAVFPLLNALLGMYFFFVIFLQKPYA